MPGDSDILHNTEKARDTMILEWRDMPIEILELSHTRPFSIVFTNIIIAVHSSCVVSLFW